MNPGIHCIVSESDNPYFNLAVEELLLKKKTGDYFILSKNSPSVIIGKHQSPHIEVNTRFVTENNIPVIRRISGGGTVYHDHGNLNFSFIVNSTEGHQVDFQKYTKPIVNFLISKGIAARFEGRNDLRVNGYKISGNAEHVFRNRVLHHGTLLFNASIDALESSLRKDASCYSSKSVRSVPAGVTNIKGMISNIDNVDDLMNEMMNYFIVNLPDAHILYMDGNENNEAMSLAGEKYSTWDWNYAYGPEYYFFKTFNFRYQKVSCRLYVREGTIRESILEGHHLLKSLQSNLTGVRHMPGDVSEALGIEDLDVFNFF